MIEKILIILFSLTISIYLVIFFFQSYKNKKMKDHVLSICKAYGVIEERNQKVYLHINETMYEVLFFYVPTQGELTINSRTIWEVRSMTKSNLVNQSIFLSSDKPKIVIIHPSTLPIKRYINENELVFVSFNDFFYNMYVVKYHEIETFFQTNTL